MWTSNPFSGKVDVIIAAGCDRIDTDLKDPILRKIVLWNKRRKSEKKLLRKNRIYKETFYGPDDYKLLERINGKPLLQHTIDNIVMSDHSWLARELGIDGIIGGIVVVGDRQALEPVITVPDGYALSFIEQGKSLYENMNLGFSSLFPDRKALPDQKEGFFHIKDRQMQKSAMSWKTKARLEFYSELAHEMMQDRTFTISRDKAVETIESKKHELISRYHFPQRLAMHEGRLADIILKNPVLKTGDAVSFANGAAFEYFNEFYRRNERFAVFIGGDSLFPDPGITIAIRQFLTDRYDVFMNFAADEAIEVFAGDFAGRKRPYMHLEHLLRTTNCHILRPNKIGNQNLLKDVYNSVRLMNPYIALRTLSKITYDPESDAPFWKFWKRFHMDNFRLVSKALYNQKVVLGYLSRNSYETDSGKYAQMARRYWENRSYLEISRFERALSQIFNANIKTNILPSGLLTIDLDSKDVDKPSIESNYDRWQSIEKKRIKAFLKEGLLDSDLYLNHINSLLEKTKSMHDQGEIDANYFKRTNYRHN